MTANELILGIVMKVLIAAPLVIAYICIADCFDRWMLNMHIKRIRDRRSESWTAVSYAILYMVKAYPNR